MSRKIASSTILEFVRNNIDIVTYDDLRYLSSRISSNTLSIEDIYDRLDLMMSCIVKMANCI